MKKTKKPKPVKAALVALDGLSVSQTKALEAILAGDSFASACRKAGCSRPTLKSWLDNDGPFKTHLGEATRELADRIERARKSLADSILQTAALGSARLARHIQSTDANKSLAAAKAAYAGGVALVKGSEDTGVNVGPMFVLPAGTFVSLDTSAPALPIPVEPISVQVIDSPGDK